MQRIVLIGSGNVATQLGLAFKEKGLTILHVHSRRLAQAEILGQRLGCTWGTDLEVIPGDADAYLFAVKDDSIKKLAQSFRCEGIALHTSGTVEIDALSPISRRYGVLYPLQTLTKDTRADFSCVPFLVEGNTSDTLATTMELAAKLSTEVRELNSEARRKMHLAAVWVNNFSNFMLLQAEEYCRKKGLSFKLLKPLAEETVRKAFAISPFEAQTGPARRRDEGTMEKHLKMLEGDQRELYALLSEMIGRMV